MKKKFKLFEDERIIIYAKEELEVGKEAEVADSVLTAALIGYKTMAQHLKDPKVFLDEVWFGIVQCFEGLRETFNQLN